MTVESAPKDKNKEVLYTCQDFISFGLHDGVLMLNRLDKNSEYNPSFGALLKDVEIFKDKKHGFISITGKKYKTKYLFSLLPCVKIIRTKKLEKYFIKEDDVLFSAFGFSVIKKGYYLLKKPFTINRCLYNTPIIFSNCYSDGSP